MHTSKQRTHKNHIFLPWQTTTWQSSRRRRWGRGEKSRWSQVWSVNWCLSRVPGGPHRHPQCPPCCHADMLHGDIILVQEKGKLQCQVKNGPRYYSARCQRSKMRKLLLTEAFKGVVCPPPVKTAPSSEPTMKLFTSPCGKAMQVTATGRDCLCCSSMDSCKGMARLYFYMQFCIFSLAKVHKSCAICKDIQCSILLLLQCFFFMTIIN